MTLFDFKWTARMILGLRGAKAVCSQLSSSVSKIRYITADLFFTVRSSVLESNPHKRKQRAISHGISKINFAVQWNSLECCENVEMSNANLVKSWESIIGN